MTLELIRTWWPILATVLNVLFLLACFVLIKTFARKEELQSIKEAHRSGPQFSDMTLSD
ncbi:DUF2730 family protein [Grimontia marina]|uniref:Uncharacterized protein n=1 Tax=Grimontia marina TaxID=646534 RepID=A0A128FIX3_9GAMM|nr:DUF2730 family protein [Grimontia marina]CZF86743.1 hypothetical protein GMA8713_04782 [Grimontia marina]